MTEVDDETSFPDNEDDEKDAGPAPSDSPPNSLSFMDNKNDTLSMYYNGTRISGERLSYGLIRH